MEDKELAKPGEISSGKLFVKINSLSYADGSLKEEVLQWTIGKNVLNAEPSKKYLYDKVVYDSPLEKENIMNEVDHVIVYGKIPQKSICIPNIPTTFTAPTSSMWCNVPMAKKS